MIISFDLDDTLICLDSEVPKEATRVPFIWRLFYKEPLRRGTVELMRRLTDQGWQIAIYTTSFRSVSSVKRFFKFYGVSLVKVVNQPIHVREVIGNRKIPLPSKYPSKFGFKLHVDDQESFISDGARFGFDVIVVNSDDLNWTQKVLAKAEQIKERDK